MAYKDTIYAVPLHRFNDPFFSQTIDSLFSLEKEMDIENNDTDAVMVIYCQNMNRMCIRRLLHPLHIPSDYFDGISVAKYKSHIVYVYVYCGSEPQIRFLEPTKELFQLKVGNYTENKEHENLNIFDIPHAEFIVRHTGGHFEITAAAAYCGPNDFVVF